MRPSLLAASIALLLPIASPAEPPLKHPAPHPAEARAGAVAASLPVTHVSLYKNGVGFIEHTGRVSGDAAVTIDFTSSQLNDVLQSLTAIDLNGGRISGAGYNSTTPLDQQLKNLPLSLDDNPTAADFYSAIRGARIEVHSPTASITGRLLSVEARTVPTKSFDGTNTPNPPQQYFLTVVADSGEVRTVELTPSTTVRLTENALHTDLSRYLQLIDANRSQGLRHLTLDDRGSGTRELRVSYISEVPIWKSTYRILFTDPASNPGAPSSRPQGAKVGSQDAGTATLQGWSVVDNTTGTDWNNVQLSLIAGAPQSFIQPLSQPIYSRRPEIPIAQEAQLTPQTFDSSIEDEMALRSPNKIPKDIKMMKQEGAPPPSVAGMAAMSGMPSGGPGGIMGGLAKGRGIGSGSGGSIGGGVYARNYADLAQASITPQTQTAGFDDFFAYNLTQPITIRKNESALVPILQAKVAADPVTLVSSNGYSTSQPLRALWITNTSGLTLDRGSFTIVENGAFGGEGLLDPIHPDEKRLLSYAADQAVHVATEDQRSGSRVTRISAAKGVLTLHHADTRAITYVIHNSASAPRTIVLEHPVERGFKLDPGVTPTETTATVHRFRLQAAPGETVRLHVSGRRELASVYHLTNSNDQQLTVILNESDNNPALVQALQPILDARRRVADAQTAVDQTKTRLDGLRSDEDRQRANITALKDADKSARERFVNDLNHTEDAITTAQSELTTRTAALESAKSDLANRIETLQLDETI